MWRLTARTRSASIPCSRHPPPSLAWFSSTGWSRSRASANRASGVSRASNSSHSARSSVPCSAGSRPKRRVGRGSLPLVLRGQPGLVVDEGVAGVDLDEVVEQEHRDDPREVDRLVGVLGQDQARTAPGARSARPSSPAGSRRRSSCGAPPASAGRPRAGRPAAGQPVARPAVLEPAHATRLASAHTAAIRPTAGHHDAAAPRRPLEIAVPASSGGRTRARTLPTNSAPPRASTNSGEVLDVTEELHLAPIVPGRPRLGRTGHHHDARRDDQRPTHQAIVTVGTSSRNTQATSDGGDRLEVGEHARPSRPAGGRATTRYSGTEQRRSSRRRGAPATTTTRAAPQSAASANGASTTAATANCDEGQARHPPTSPTTSLAPQRDGGIGDAGERGRSSLAGARSGTRADEDRHARPGPTAAATRTCGPAPSRPARAGPARSPAPGAR